MSIPQDQNAIDFVVTAYLVHAGKVLLVYHNALEKWLPVGGHIEPNEDPEEALFREIEEETGLAKSEFKVVGNTPEAMSATSKFLLSPRYLDIHRISDTHRHVSMVYFIEAKTDKVTLAENEHRAMHWFTQEELDLKEFALMPEIVFYCRKAEEEVAGG